MTDDRSKRRPHDRAKVAKGQSYEVAYFAKKHAISIKDASQIIARTRSRAAADAQADRLKRSRRWL